MEIRPVRDDELPSASRLIAPGLVWRPESSPAATGHALEQAGMDLRRQIVAVADGKLLGTCLYVLAPGRSAVVLPPVLSDRCWAAASADVLVKLVGRAREACRQAGAVLIQALLEEGPGEPMAQAFGAAGFAFLAALEYLEVALSRPPEAPAGEIWEYQTYRPELDEAFADLIAETYRESMDCPALDRLRTPRDALAGHKATGIFTPENWILARHGGIPAGLVLVNRVVGRSACELVYMGVAPPFRNRGLGKCLVRKAMERTFASGRRVLALAVDENNGPARRIYEEAGFRKVGRRYAYYVAPADS